MITEVGPTALFSNAPPPSAKRDPRVQVNEQQVGKVADIVASIDELAPYTFIDP